MMKRIGWRKTACLHTRSPKRHPSVNHGAILLLSILMISQAAIANAVTITSGDTFLRVGLGPPGVIYNNMAGDGLVFTGIVPDPSFIPLPCSVFPCPSGGSVNMSFSIPGQLIRGTATIDGLPSAVPASASSQFNFHGSADIPPTSGILDVSYPFTFDGTLQTATTLFNLDGDGIATLRLLTSGGQVFVAAGNFDFAAAIPEPSTFLLFASGIGALGWWRRRVSKSRCRDRHPMLCPRSRTIHTQPFCSNTFRSSLQLDVPWTLTNRAKTCGYSNVPPNATVFN
jgi:hypothetical protein